MRSLYVSLILFALVAVTLRAEELTDKQLELLANDSIGIINLPQAAWSPTSGEATRKLMALPESDQPRIKTAFWAAWKDISPLGMIPNQKDALEVETKLKWSAWQAAVGRGPSGTVTQVSVRLDLNADGSGKVHETVNLSAFMRKTQPDEEVADFKKSDFDREIQKAFDAHWGERTFKIGLVEGVERVKAELNETVPGLWMVDAEVKFKSLDALNALSKNYGNPLMATYTLAKRATGKTQLFAFTSTANDLEEWEFIQQHFSDWRVNFALSFQDHKFTRSTGKTLPDGAQEWSGPLTYLMFANAVLAEVSDAAEEPAITPRVLTESKLPEPKIEDPNADVNAVNEGILAFAQSLLDDPDPLKRYRGLKYCMPVEEYSPIYRPPPLVPRGTVKALLPKVTEALNDPELFIQYTAYATLKRYVSKDLEDVPGYWETEKWKGWNKWNVDAAPAPVPVQTPVQAPVVPGTAVQTPAPDSTQK